MRLSRRELDILTLVACGFTDKEISIKLKISTRTIQTHMNIIVNKLNAKNRLNAAIIYLQHNPTWKINERYVAK